MKLCQISCLAAIPALLAACAELPVPDMGAENPPMAFHDTRLKYATLAADQDRLAKDFGMKSQPSWPERAVAGLTLPVTAATDSLFFPVFSAIKAYAPAQRRGSN